MNNKTVAATKRSRYGRFASVYDLLGLVWTFGTIKKSKHWHLQFLQPQQTVLFAGAGSGDEAILAASKGVKVVIIDLSAKMLQLAKDKCIKANINNIQFIPGDVMDHHQPLHYDAVVANYFLDVFDAETMPVVLQHLKTQLKTNGMFLISGFAPVKNSFIKRMVVNVFHGVPLLVFHFFAGNALHDIYDYTQPLEQVGFVIKEWQYFSIVNSYFPITHSLCAVPTGTNA